MQNYIHAHTCFVGLTFHNMQALMDTWCKPAQFGRNKSKDVCVLTQSIEAMRTLSEQYARKSDTFRCVDKGVTAVVVQVCFTFF